MVKKRNFTQIIFSACIAAMCCGAAHAQSGLDEADEFSEDGGASVYFHSLPHNQIVNFPESVDDFEATFKPRLFVDGGCVPYPAVDAYGNVGRGLRPTYPVNGGCSQSIGQVYVRAETYHNECAVMYAWYFPKDIVVLGQGHTHDWEAVVVWLSQCSSQAQINAVSYSAHGGYQTLFRPPLYGSRPLVKYTETDFPFNHSLTYTDHLGGSQPAIAWFRLTPAARQALSDADFGAAIVPFKDSTFQHSLDKAWESRLQPLEVN
ncbi:NPP1 family protein [Acidovorax sp. LjRoot194]|uniref:NPP1 family protein n=1 Tax=Acidovorax sp. LjRoot194 TaxID=3342280 RepID=UPI003ED0CFFB